MEIQHQKFSDKTPFLYRIINKELSIINRNMTTNIIDPSLPCFGQDLKIKDKRNFTIDLAINGINRAVFHKRYPLEIELEKILNDYKIGEKELKEKKDTKSEKQTSEKNSKLIRARFLLIQGFSSKAVSDLLRISLNDIIVIRRKIKAKKITKLQKRGCKSKIKREHLSYFLDMFRLNSTKLLTTKEFRQKFLERFNLPPKYITISGLRKFLKRKLKLSWKRVSYYKKEQDMRKTIDDRFRFVSDILPFISQNYKLVFLDECSFNLSLSRASGWNFTNKRIFFSGSKKVKILLCWPQYHKKK